MIDLSNYDLSKLSYSEKAELLSLLEEQERRQDIGGHLVKIWPDDGPLSWKHYHKHMRFFEATNRHSEVYFSAANRVGKACRNGTPVLTPKGWKNIEDLSVGDEVVDGRGCPTYVTGVFPQGNRALYRITFDDGAHVDVDGQHLWKCQVGKQRYKDPETWHVYSTDELVKKGVFDGNNQKAAHVPVTKSYMSKRELKIPPYILGAMIGDGCYSGCTGEARFSTADPELIEYIEVAYKTRKDATRKYDYAVNELVTDLKWEGLWGTKSHEKRIPYDYLWSSELDRLELLRGLMDTDGSVSTGHDSEFYTTSEELADQVVFLVQSLGGKARKRNKQTYFYQEGEKVPGRPSFGVSVLLPVCPFRLPRKAKRWRKPQHRIVRRFKAIEPIGQHEATCISVLSDDRTFVTKNFIVTHNSIAGAYATACHLTGSYPHWWPGRKFDKPINAWACGDTSQTTRDIVQKELLGPPGEEGTGMIAKDAIIDIRRKPGVPGAIESARIRSENGGTSHIGFKSYDQGRRSFQGTAMDWIWTDEEVPADVYGECVMRLMTTNGVIIITATPIKGLTTFVQSFLDDAERDEVDYKL